MSASLEFVERYKALRKQFYPAQKPVARRIIPRVPQGMIIYAEAIGPTNTHVKRGGKLLYRTPIGPSRPADGPVVEIKGSAPREWSPMWIAEAKSRGLLDAPISAPERALAVISEVLCAINLPWSSIISEGRLLEIVTARRLISYRLYTVCAWSTPQIGRLMRRDHSSIVHHIRNYTASQMVRAS